MYLLLLTVGEQRAEKKEGSFLPLSRDPCNISSSTELSYPVIASDHVKIEDRLHMRYYRDTLHHDVMTRREGIEPHGGYWDI